MDGPVRRSRREIVPGSYKTQDLTERLLRQQAAKIERNFIGRSFFKNRGVLGILLDKRFKGGVQVGFSAIQ